MFFQNTESGNDILRLCHPEFISGSHMHLSHTKRYVMGSLYFFSNTESGNDIKIRRSAPSCLERMYDGVPK